MNMPAEISEAAKQRAIVEYGDVGKLGQANEGKPQRRPPRTRPTFEGDVSNSLGRCGHRFRLHSPALGKDINPIPALPALLSFCPPARVNFEPTAGWNDTDMEPRLILKRWHARSISGF
jgi:hypothetical protein